jgi:hypothetical protein
VPTETLEEFAQPRGTAARRLHEVDMGAGELFSEHMSDEVRQESVEQVPA